MNCVLLHYVVSGGYYVAEGTPVRVLRMVDGSRNPPVGWVSDFGQDVRLDLECLASFAFSADGLVRDVVVSIPPESLKFMSVDPGQVRR